MPTVAKLPFPQAQPESDPELFWRAIQSMRFAVAITDSEPKILAVNPAFSRITGWSAEEVVGKHPRILSSGHHDAAFYKTMWGSLAERGFWEGEIWNRNKAGIVYPEWLSISAIPDDRGKPERYVAVFSDITQRKESERRLRAMAFADSLTELPNRVAFQTRLVSALKLSQRNHWTTAVIAIDLDGFKGINDTFGHDAGDRVLKTAAQRLTASIRESDTAARFGGDEFMVLAQDTNGESGCRRIAERILEALCDSYGLPTKSISASLGIALFPEHGENPDDLVKAADTALYAAKQAGKACYRFAAANNPES